ncbi:MAG TPA: hypothetical protein VK616_02010 [Flavitalea sp.]|nr:hypothetical protein [Flavitalea sp.]
MEFRLIFFAYLALCAFVFFEVLVKFRKNSLLKICFLLILSSLFVMNYLSYTGVSNRFQFVLVKSMRIIYVCSTMLAIIRLVTPKIPRWIIGMTVFSVIFLIGIRMFYYKEIAIKSPASFSGQVFSVGPEFNAPIPFVRYPAFALAALVAAITFYYYRLFFLKINREDIYYKQLSRWIISMVVPFFLLVIFAALGILDVFEESMSPYLFSTFSCTIIFSILFRPKFLNTASSLNEQIP